MNKEYAFYYDTPLDHYVAQAFVVRCFDDRFRPAVEAFLKERGITQYDAESVAGGGKIFSSPEDERDREFMFRELEKSIRLHAASRVVLFSHHECGAYGGLDAFGDDREREFLYHREEHTAARALVKTRFPSLAVETYFIDEKGVVKTF